MQKQKKSGNNPKEKTHIKFQHFHKQLKNKEQKRTWKMYTVK